MAAAQWFSDLASLAARRNPPSARHLQQVSDPLGQAAAFDVGAILQPLQKPPRDGGGDPLGASAQQASGI
jgi:hypothetical protein